MLAHREVRRFETGVLKEIARIVALAAGLWLIGMTALSAQDPRQEQPFEYDQAQVGAELEGTYGYVRMMDGTATLIQPDGERIQVQANEPVLVGDRLFVSGDSRVEIVLADRNIVRLGPGADLGFVALANSADATDPNTHLDVRRGTVQVVVVDGQLGARFPTLRTPNSSVEFQQVGTYLVVVDDEEHTEVIVRQGQVAVLTGGDGAEVRAGESLFVSGAGNASFEFAAAPSVDELESWGNGLTQYASEDAGYVDGELAYGAATLEDNGSWISVGSTYAWRPYVSVGWAPYRNGRWRYTPTGWFWVSYDRWGWVPHHYGYWDYHNAYGWMWYPGRRFASAHVYFYWGAGGYAGWCPTGYYTGYYGGYYGNRFGYYHGSYGYVRGTGWYSKNRYWTFLPTDRLGHRRQNVYAVSGEELGRRGRSLGRGVLTTDTRALTPDVWRRPADGVTRLARDASRQGRELGDATAFVNRTELPTSLERVTLRGRSGESRTASSGGLARESDANGAATVGRGTARGGVDALRPNIETSPRAVGGRTAETNPLGRTGLSRGGEATRGSDPLTGRSAAGGGSQSNPSSGGLARPRTTGRETAQPTTRSPRTPTIDRGRSGTTGTPSGLRRPETQSRSRSNGDLRRPTSPVTSSPRLDRSSTRPQARGGTSGGSRPTVGSTSRSRPTVSGSSSRSRPTVGSGTSSRSRPTVSGSSSRSRPTVRSGSSGGSRPTVRSGSGSSSRPTVRSGSGSSSRPTVRSGSSGGSRPTVRTSRPTVRSGSSSGSRSRPTVRSSGSSRSSGATRSSGPSRSSGASRSSGSSRSSGASRSSGPSRSSGASRSSGSSRSSGAARSSGSSRSSGASRSSGGSRRSGGSASRPRRGGS